MRIIVSDVAAQMGGAIVILKGLYNYIREHDHENEWIFLLSRPFVEETGNIKVILYENVKKSPINRVFYDLFEGKKLEKKYHPDLFFSLWTPRPHNQAVQEIVRVLKRIKSVCIF